MLRNRVAETSVAPGTATTINLAGAVANRRTFISEFTTGSSVFYVMDDGTQSEAGYGVITAGAPNTLARTVVLWNSSTGRVTPARLNFTGTVTVFCDVPSERAVFTDGNNLTTLLGGLTVASTLTVNGASTMAGGGSFAASYTASGHQRLPGGLILQWGVAGSGAGGTVTQTFPIVFPTQCLIVLPTIFGAVGSGPAYTTMVGSWNTADTTFYTYANGTLTSGIGVLYSAIGN